MSSKLNDRSILEIRDYEKSSGTGKTTLLSEASVISPEGCAAILWREKTKASLAASCLKLTAPELIELGIIDGKVKEPLGGAHRDPEGAANEIKRMLLDALDELSSFTVKELVDERYKKYRNMGVYREG